jgi:N-acetylglucosamine-6-phosphate deacetylase
VREHIRPPDVEEARHLISAGNGTLRRVTLAPELPAARTVIELLASSAVQVSLGHTQCSYEVAIHGIEWGANSVTHVYNAMAPFHHRAPGLVGAALADERLLVEVIADGVHVDSAAVLAVVLARGAEHVCVVTDGLPPLGLARGAHEWQGRRIESDGGVCRLPDGTLAGSATSMLDAVRNLASWGVPLEDCARMAAGTGAGLAGVAKRKGQIAVGFDADLVLLDNGLQLVASYCRGEPAHW